MSPDLLVLPGDGAVIRDGDAVAILTGAVTSDVVAQIQGHLRGADSDAGFRSVVAMVMAAPTLDGVVVRFMGDAVTAFAVGEASVVTTDATYSGAGHPTGVSVQCAATAFVAAGAGTPNPAAAGWQTIESGAVAGVGIAPRAGAPAPAQAAPAPVRGPAGEPEPETRVNKAMTEPPNPPPPPPPPPAPAVPAAGAEFKLVSLSDSIDLSELEPLDAGGEAHPPPALPKYAEPVTVLGVLSPTGHFNHPEARYCSRTGVKMGASQTRALVEGVRPPLGVITFESGATYSVQHDTVIGREPETDQRVIAETAAGLSIVDDNREISRQHLLIELVDWDVYATDMETANGTWIRDQPGVEPRRLGRGERAILNSGAEIYLGNTRFIYHEHHVR